MSMKRYGRVEDGRIVEIVSTENIDAIYHPDMVARFFEILPEVQMNWVKTDNGFEAPVYEEHKLSDSQLKTLCKTDFENLISKYYTDKELIHMQLSLAAGKSKAKKVYEWIQSGIEQVMKYHAQINFGEIPAIDYSNLGCPPFTYEEVITE